LAARDVVGKNLSFEGISMHIRWSFMKCDPHGQRKCFDASWPPVRGDYVVGNRNARVAVVTLASLLQVGGPAITGPCKTENLGVEKIVANVISNCSIRFLVICGVESKGHLPGNTLLALHRNGIDEQGRIIGSKGAIPFIQNLSPEAVLRFQEQVELIDCIGIEDIELLEELIGKYNRLSLPAREVSASEGDLLFSAEVVMDTSAWLVFIAEG
jgi:tetrahydromethanopterin S-methyltransferase subunit A